MRNLDVLRNALTIAHVIRQQSVESNGILAGTRYLWCTDSGHPSRVCLMLLVPNTVLTGQNVHECKASNDHRYPCAYHWLSVYAENFTTDRVPAGWHIECDI